MPTAVVLLVIGVLFFLLSIRRSQLKSWRKPSGNLAGVPKQEKSLKDTLGEHKRPSQQKDSRDVLRRVK